jgi:hypothetical protein
MGYRAQTNKGFIYAKGSIPVLLVAHLDTVHRKTVKTICYSPNGKIIMSPEGIGGDDRAGVFMIQQIIKEHRCHVLFCEDEERGGIGASRFIESKIKPEVNYIVELDRRGSNDAVFYDCDNQDFTRFVKGFGFVEDFGSFSDISIIAPKLGIAAVNISAGYYNEHTLHEHVDMEAVENNIKRVGEMVAATSERFDYIEDRRFSLFDRYRDDLLSKSLGDLKANAETFGVSEEEVDLLLEYGYGIEEIEDLLNFPKEFSRAVKEVMDETADVMCEYRACL